MTAWDIRALLRALGAALLGLLVVWLVTAASDEGQLTVGARAGRTLPVAPLCSAVGAALALGTARVAQEARALEALGRSPAVTSRAAALGAALPSVLVGLAILAIPSVDVAAFYPRAAIGETFVLADDGTFVSPSLGVRVDADGEAHALDGEAHALVEDEGLPPGARLTAAAATALAGVGLSLVAARAALRRSLLDRRARRRLRVVALGEALGCAILTLVAFQAAAARAAPAALAVMPPLALLAAGLARMRYGQEGAWQKRW
ncbi:MAG: hypothetical protein KF795_12865 [Labilithrix sp.]|nr:hypothetical protein [Labilithrix sp.]